MSNTSGALLAPCSNCGTSTPIAALLRDPSDGSLHCTRCPGEAWLRRTYGERAVEELIALREHRPGAPTLADLVATYPERAGQPRRDACQRGHPFTPANTYVDVDGSRQCRTCKNAKAREARQRVTARRAASRQTVAA